MTDKEIIRALRCCVTVHTEKMDCTECPCYVREEIPEELRAVCEVDHWDSCEADAVILAAADRLEEVTRWMSYHSAEEPTARR